MTGISDLPSALAAFEESLRASGAGVVRYLAPGIPEERVRRGLAAIGLEPSQELIDWFAWHDGVVDQATKSSGDGYLLQWAPLSLDEAIADWHNRDKEEAWEWQPEWLPIATADASTLAVLCAPPQGLEATVRDANPWFGLFDESQVPSVTGFATVVKWWTEAIEHGWWQYIPSSDMWDNTRWGEMPPERRNGLV
jgi:hypothetical protein